MIVINKIQCPAEEIFLDSTLGTFSQSHSSAGSPHSHSNICETANVLILCGCIATDRRYTPCMLLTLFSLNESDSKLKTNNDIDSY